MVIVPILSFENLIKGDAFQMLQAGDTAPDFELPSHLEKDKKVRLSQLKGKNVVIAFYPLDWTPV